MNFKMNFVTCVIVLAISQYDFAVYQFYMKQSKSRPGVYEAQKCVKYGNSSNSFLRGKRLPILPYGNLMITLLGLPVKDNRDMSIETSRSTCISTVAHNTPIRSCSSARKPCIVVNNLLVYLVDTMVQDRAVIVKR